MLDSMNIKKRMRSEEEEEISSFTNHVGIEEMAKCLMLLSHHFQNGPIQAKPISMYRPEAAPKESSLMRFECKTCDRSFSSFQALGGHRASHKKPRVDRGDDMKIVKSIKAAAGAGSTRKHECNICGVVFSMGQALGGHMRRHRECRITSSPPPQPQPQPPVLVLKRSTSHLKVSSINTFLDLNLTPLENDLKLLFG